MADEILQLMFEEQLKTNEMLKNLNDAMIELKSELDKHITASRTTY